LTQNDCISEVDLALLTSTLLTPGAQLWTRDKRLAQLASRFAVVYMSALRYTVRRGFALAVNDQH